MVVLAGLGMAPVTTMAAVPAVHQHMQQDKDDDEYDPANVVHGCLRGLMALQRLLKSISAGL